MDSFMGSKKILEINVNHRIFKTLKDKIKDENLISHCVNITQLLFDTAQINSGFILEKPSDYASKVNKLVQLGFCDDDGDDDENDELPDLVEETDNIVDEVEDMEQVD